jgi:hypothetical protein
MCTAKNQYRNFKTNIPRKGNARPQSQFPHSWVFYIFTQSICLFCCRWTAILRIHKSLTDIWMWKLGLRQRNSQKRNTLMGFSLQCGLRFIFVAVWFEIHSFYTVLVSCNTLFCYPFWANQETKASRDIFLALKTTIIWLQCLLSGSPRE